MPHNIRCMEKVTVALADDHLLFAESLANLLFSHPEYVHSFSVYGAEPLLELLAERHPDVLILDVNLPPYNGLHLIPEVRKASPHTKILMLSMHQPSDYNLTEDTFTADGYILKTSGKEVLIQAIATLVSSDEPYFCPDIQWSQVSTENIEQVSVLTRREKEIIRMISEGKTSREIAEVFKISENTVKTHRTRIRKKMKVGGIAELLNKIKQFRI